MKGPQVGQEAQRTAVSLMWFSYFLLELLGGTGCHLPLSSVRLLKTFQQIPCCHYTKS
jgi:hypothetical protein